MSISERAMATVAPPAEKAGARCPHCKQPWLHRSDADHGMFWAIVTKACKNWPETHPFKPNGLTDEDRVNNLYGWLLVEVGYVDVGDIESHEAHNVNAGLHTARRVVKGKKLHYWRLIETPTGWQLIVPKSLDYKTAGKRQFEDVRSKVYEIIETVLGTPIETLKREAKMAA